MGELEAQAHLLGILLGRNWEYRFFVDVEGNLSEPSIQNAIKAMSEEAANLRILGNY